MRRFSDLVKTVVLITTLINLLGAVAVSAASISVDIPNVGCPIGGPCPTAVEAKGSISLNIIRIYQFAVAIAGIFAVGMIVAGSVYYSASAGSPDRQSEGKDMITSAIWGIVLLFGSYLILNTVNPRLTALEEPYAPAAVPCQYSKDKDGNLILIKQYDAEGNLLPCLPPKFKAEDILIPGENPATAISSTTVRNASDTAKAYCLSIGYTDDRGNKLPGLPTVITVKDYYGNLKERRLFDECVVRANCYGGKCVSLYSDLPVKSNQCRWYNEASNCQVNQKVNNALRALNAIFPGANRDKGWIITEAFPPVVTHLSDPHYNGCAVDIAAVVEGRQSYITERDCPKIRELIQAAERQGFEGGEGANEYKQCGGKQYETTTGGHIHLKLKNCP